MTAATDPYEAYTAEAEYFEAGWADMARTLPPFTAGVLGAVGRLLAVVVYARADEPAGDGAALELPDGCSGRGPEFAQLVARCFDDLASDIEAGRAPLPRSTAERWALQVMIERAPFVLAASDAELAALGVPVPDEEYEPPYWEALYEFLTEGAEFSIPEARPAGNDEHDDVDEVPEPDGGWDGPDYWFSPYGITKPRDPDRGHRSADHAPAGAGTLGVERAAELTGLGPTADPWVAWREDFSAHMTRGPLAEFLTPQCAMVLRECAGRIMESGIHDLADYGSEPFDRGDDDGEDWGEESFLGSLPRICDRQDARWRLDMLRAVSDLADDLNAGRAPLPRTTAEEIALHLILRSLPDMLDEMAMEEADAAAGFAPGQDDQEPPFPRRSELSPRHVRVPDMLEAFTVDDDVLMLYDVSWDGIEDPDDPTNQLLHMGNLRPGAWHDPSFFRYVVPRDPDRGYPSWIVDFLTRKSDEWRDILL